MKRLKIVLSNASASWGGVHYVTEALVHGLQKRGHDIVLFGRPKSALEERMRDSVPFEPILRGMDLSPFRIGQAARAMRRHATDVVLTLMKKDVRLTGPAARMLGIPFIVRHANDRPLRNQPDHRLFFGKFPARHVANSHATRETVLKSAPWLRRSDIDVIYNGIDAHRFDRVTPAALGLPEDAIVVAFIGRIEERKGVLDLAAAWPAVSRAVPNAHLIVVGKGNAEQEFRSALGDAGNVHWLGYRADIDEVLRATDVVAMLSHWEGFGLVALEAMAAGVPVLATTVSSLREIVTHGEHGLLVEPGETQEIASALIRLLSSEQERKRMGIAGRERAHDVFGVDVMVDQYEELFLRVANTSSSAEPVSL